MTDDPPPARSNDDTDARARFDPRTAVICGLFALLYVAARLWRLTTECLWFDEIFSVHAARHHGWADMLGFVKADLVHPPLFYVLLKLWLALGGESLLWLRLLPALAACAAVVPLLSLCRELRLTAVETNLALALCAVNGYLIHYAQTVRMYSLLNLLALCSLWLFARLCRVEDDRRMTATALLFTVNLLLVYTHYFGWLIVGAELVFLLVWRRHVLTVFVTAHALVLLCFLPWAIAVAREAAGGDGDPKLAQNIGWAARPGLSALARFFITLNEPFFFREALYAASAGRTALWSAFYFALFGVPILLWLARSTSRRIGSVDIEEEKRNGRWLGMFVFMSVAGAFVLSLILPHSVWGVRHLVFVATPFLMLVAVAVMRLRPKWLRTALLCVFAGWAVIAAASLALRRNAPHIWCAWDELAPRLARAESSRTSEIKIYAFEDLTAYHLWFALDTLREQRFRIVTIKDIPGLIEDPAYFLPRRFDEVSRGDPAAVQEERFWLAYRDASFNPDRQPLKTFLAMGYQAGAPLKVEARGLTAFLVPLQRKP